MKYTARTGDTPAEAHVNYTCPCGCTAGVIYHRESGSMELGSCCCGRLLWVGDDAEARVRAAFEPEVRYKLDIGRVTLPWGEKQRAALAVPQKAKASHD